MCGALTAPPCAVRPPGLQEDVRAVLLVRRQPDPGCPGACPRCGKANCCRGHFTPRIARCGTHAEGFLCQACWWSGLRVCAGGAELRRKHGSAHGPITRPAWLLLGSMRPCSPPPGGAGLETRNDCSDTSSSSRCWWRVPARLGGALTSLISFAVRRRAAGPREAPGGLRAPRRDEGGHG